MRLHDPNPEPVTVAPQSTPQRPASSPISAFSALCASRQIIISPERDMALVQYKKIEGAILAFEKGKDMTLGECKDIKLEYGNKNMTIITGDMVNQVFWVWCHRLCTESYDPSAQSVHMGLQACVHIVPRHLCSPCSTNRFWRVRCNAVQLFCLQSHNYNGRAVLQKPEVFLRTALKDRPQGPPTANRQATNRQPLPTANPETPTGGGGEAFLRNWTCRGLQPHPPF